MTNTNKKIIGRLLQSHGYIMMNRELAISLGVEPAFLLMVMIDGQSMVSSRDEWFFQTTKKLEQLTGLSHYKQTSAIKILIKKGVLEQENRGVPCKRYFRINVEKIAEILAEELEKQNSNNSNSSIQETQILESEKLEHSFQETSKHYKEHNINNINKEHNINKKINKKNPRQANIDAVETSSLSPARKEKLKEWIDYRFDEIKKPLKTTRAIKTIINSKWIQESNAVEFIEHCMNHEWQGLEQKIYDDVSKSIKKPVVEERVYTDWILD